MSIRRVSATEKRTSPLKEEKLALHRVERKQEKSAHTIKIIVRGSIGGP